MISSAPKLTLNPTSTNLQIVTAVGMSSTLGDMVEEGYSLEEDFEGTRGNNKIRSPASRASLGVDGAKSGRDTALRP